jgi:ligand-binding sensor domain-containing protein
MSRLLPAGTRRPGRCYPPHGAQQPVVHVGARSSLHTAHASTAFRFFTTASISTTRDGLSSNKIHFIDRDQKGHLWVGTANGLDRYGRGTFASYDSGDERSSSDILALCRDREGNVWLGYRNLGLARVREGPFTSYTKKEGLADDYVATVLQDAKGGRGAGCGVFDVS